MKKAIISSLFAFSCFSISDALRKLMSQDFLVVDILFWQAVCGIILVLLSSFFIGDVKLLFNVQTIKWQFIRGLLIAANTCLSLMVISRIPIVDAYTIFFLSPFVVSLMGMFFLKETIGTFRLFSILCGFSGAFIAFRPGFEEVNPVYLYAVLCVFTFASSSVLARYMGRASGLLSFASWPFLCLIAGIFVYKGGV